MRDSFGLQVCVVLGVVDVSYGERKADIYVNTLRGLLEREG